MLLHGIILFVLVLLASVSVYNYLTAPYLEKLERGAGASSRVSVLIPARNEEKNISKCLDSVYQLDYNNMEVIVCDDQSTDDTPRLLDAYKTIQPGLKVIRAPDKPEGWTGKNWACHNLYKQASGDILFFLDADVAVAPSCLNNTVPFLTDKKAALISCFPRQLMRTAGEWLVVPLMNWILLSLLPLALVYKAAQPSLCAANGQFMLFNRKEYEDMGGHVSVKNKLVEDVAIANTMKRSGKKIMTALSKTEVSCRMYEGFTNSVLGLGRSFFTGFNMPKGVFIVFVAVLFSAFFLPLVLVFSNAYYLIDIALVFLIRVLISLSSGQNVILNMILHPAQMIVMLFVAVSSLYTASTKNISWKGRRI